MKRLIVLLVVLCSFASTSKASHILGGEIGWTCLPTGKYIFYMTVYRDCTGINFNYTDETITIVGAPLPKDASGSSFDKITMKPDSNRWQAERNGDTSPRCTNQYGNPNTCDNGDQGSVQQFFYTSAALTLAGQPNRAGWKFYWESACCRPGDVTNVTTTGTMLLRAEMYRTPGSNDKDPCTDSSPEFKSLPTTSVCRGYEFTYNSTAIDSDLDSLIYSWDRPYNPPLQNPDPLVYKAGYSPTNPTPDKTFDIKNIPSTLGPLSGVINMAVYSGVTTQKFLTVIKVDSYRDGQKIATVYREIPVSVFSCPALPNGKTNNPPEVFIDGVKADGLIIDITAGQEVRLPLQVKDLDVTGIGTQLQNVTLVPDGLLFTRDRTIGPNPVTDPGSPCQVTYGAGKNLVVEPCAYLQNKTPFLDVGTSPPERKISGLSGLATEFVWETSCAHIQTKTGVPGTLEGIYNFVMRVSDDHCPIPAINYPTITVRVKDPIPLTEPIMKGIDVDLNGEITYQWVPAIDSAFTFEKYIVESATSLNGVAPATWNNLNNNLKDFQQEKKNVNFQLFFNVNPLDPTSPRNILNKRDRDWYMRMRAVSGCTDDVESPNSDRVRVMESEIVSSGGFPNPVQSRATVTWNRPKGVNAKTYPYFHYESPTHFYIWENDSISNGGVADPANWYLRGDTNATTYSIGSNVCMDYIGLRIEARDTVITWKQGNAPSPRLDSLDTLVYSTFSTIDTIYMVTPGRIPRPKLDTIEVKANGDVYIRGDRAAAGTAGTFNLYNSVVDPDSLLASLELAIEDSVQIAGQNADNKIRRLIVEAVDICNASVRENSFVYTTILPTGSFQAACPPTYTLNWNEPLGFNTAIKSYRILVDTTGTGNNFFQAASNDGTSTSLVVPVIQGTEYMFKVIATDNEGAVNISAIHTFTVPTGLPTNEVPSVPELRCTFVEDDGSVLLSFNRNDRDSTKNGQGYRIEYRRNNGAWQNFAGAGLINYDADKTDGDQGDTSALITGIDAQTARYDFRAAILGGCDGNTIDGWSNVISSIFIEATAFPNDPSKRGNVEWNSTNVDYNSTYSLYKDTFNLRYAPTLLTLGLDTTSVVDNDNGDICFGAQNYYVTIEDEFSKCISRSNIDSALYVDNFPPEPLDLNYISYDRVTGGIRAYWTRDTDSDTDSLFFTTTDGFNSGLQAYKAIGEEDYRAEEYLIPFTTLDARDSAVVVGALAQDECGNRSAEEDLTFHKSMDVEVQWNVCDSSMQITWTPYEGFNEDFDVEYTVYFDSSAAGFNNVAAIPESQGTLDTTFNHKIEVGDKVYRYFVEAVSTDPATANSGFVSASNVDSDFAIYEDVPRYGYLTFATVEDRVVNLEYYKDTLINVKGYNIFRGTDKNLMNRIGYIDFQTVKDDEIIDFTDANVDVSSFSYFYKIQVQNACDEPVDTSNLGRSILLNVKPDNEAVTNTLTWNEYVEWDSTVAYYNIYRGVDTEPTNQIYDVVPPSNDEFNLFVDDVYDDLFSIGKFCYRVEAIQGQVTNAATNGFPNDLQPAISKSNVVCVTQEPLFYIPNAFAPDGVNKTFGPKGQFFDFSLYEMVIFNRWGEEVYRTRDINKGWDGTYNGEIAQLGSYVYTIRFIDADGDEHRRKGTVTLVK